MADQETLPSPNGQPFNALEHGLWDRFKDGDHINHAAWMRACAEGAFVGSCRLCGAYLRPSYPDAVGNRTDYQAACSGCSWAFNAPSGRILQRSSSRHEMPSGWWSKRQRALNVKGGDE